MGNLTTTYSIDEFDEIQKEQQHPYVGLFNLDGSRLVAFNPHNVDPKEKIIEIKKALKSPSLTDGIYIIRCKNGLHQSMGNFDYPVVVGNPEVQHMNDHGGDNFNAGNVPVTSYQAVLDLNIQLNTLKFENDQLKKENKEQEEYIKELEKELEERDKEDEESDKLLSAQPHWSDTLMTFGENMATMFAPALDKHFELQQKKLDLEAFRIKHGANGSPNGIPNGSHVQHDQGEPTAQGDAVEYADQKIREFIEMHMNHEPDTFEIMKKLYNESESMDHFFESFKDQLGDDKFNDLILYMNGRES